jgi:hypothetical protein
MRFPTSRSRVMSGQIFTRFIIQAIEYFNVHENFDKHKINNIGIMHKKRQSLQLYNCRSKHWVVVKSRAYIEVDEKQRSLVNSKVHI